jgi:hypothetical protein
LSVVFILHFWAILIFILDAPTPETANEWGEFFAIFSYILIFALGESFVIVIALLLISYLIPREWGEDKAYGLLISILYLLAFWAVIAQVGSTFEHPDTPLFIYLGTNLRNTALYRNIAFALAYMSVIGITLAVLWAAIRGGIAARLTAFSERSMILSYLYLLIDMIAFGYVFVRNM